MKTPPVALLQREAFLHLLGIEEDRVGPGAAALLVADDAADVGEVLGEAALGAGDQAVGVTVHIGGLQGAAEADGAAGAAFQHGNALVIDVEIVDFGTGGGVEGAVLQGGQDGTNVILGIHAHPALAVLVGRMAVVGGDAVDALALGEQLVLSMYSCGCPVIVWPRQPVSVAVNVVLPVTNTIISA